MRILVLTKRQYMGKDLLDDRYGRMRELPLFLAASGHEVHGHCLSYRRRAEDRLLDEGTAGAGGVWWRSYNAGPLKLPGLVRFSAGIEASARRFRPDIVLACSDTFYGIMGRRLATRVGAKLVFDLYDNFEAFASARIPGVLPRYRRALRDAAAVTCVSAPLAALVTDVYGRRGSTHVLENAVRADLFRPMDRQVCRRELGLPPDATIIGTAGALRNDRGISALFHAFERLSSSMDNLHLAVAGPRDRTLRVPRAAHIHDLGAMPLERVPLLFNALDVAVVCNRDSTFGRFCFPQKAQEILACRVPLVAAAVGVMKDRLRARPETLFEPEDPDSLARAVSFQLRERFVPSFAVPSWDDIGGRLEDILVAALAPPGATAA